MLMITEFAIFVIVVPDRQTEQCSRRSIKVGTLNVRACACVYVDVCVII